MDTLLHVIVVLFLVGIQIHQHNAANIGGHLQLGGEDGVLTKGGKGEELGGGFLHKVPDRKYIISVLDKLFGDGHTDSSSEVGSYDTYSYNLYDTYSYDTSSSETYDSSSYKTASYDSYDTDSYTTYESEYYDTSSYDFYDTSSYDTYESEYYDTSSCDFYDTSSYDTYESEYYDTSSYDSYDTFESEYYDTSSYDSYDTYEREYYDTSSFDFYDTSSYGTYESEYYDTSSYDSYDTSSYDIFESPSPSSSSYDKHGRSPEGPYLYENPETPKGPEGKPCSPECLRACKKSVPFIFPGDSEPIFKGGFVGFDELPHNLNRLLEKGSFTYPDLIVALSELFPKHVKLNIDAVPIIDMIEKNNQFVLPGFVGSYFNLRLAVPLNNPYRIMYYMPEILNLVPCLPVGALSGTPDNPVFPVQFPQSYAEPVFICDTLTAKKECRDLVK